jgi:hypothetical protein
MVEGENIQNNGRNTPNNRQTVLLNHTLMSMTHESFPRRSSSPLPLLCASAGLGRRSAGIDQEFKNSGVSALSGFSSNNYFKKKKTASQKVDCSRHRGPFFSEHQITGKGVQEISLKIVTLQNRMWSKNNNPEFGCKLVE